MVIRSPYHGSIMTNPTTAAINASAKQPRTKTVQGTTYYLVPSPSGLWIYVSVPE